ncbi:amidohydrolase family protein [Microbacterium sp. NPDC058342]|uniref:amidohydrolase family protein n=1 Tax=Microbacterium sp. NPDC058342 TaxID=3346454 RepID=UPI003649CA1C
MDRARGGERLIVRIVDAHVHLWDVRAFPIPWFHDGLGLPEAATPGMLRAASRSCGITSAIAVQVADTVEEAGWLTALTASDALATRAVLQYEPAGRTALGATVFDGAPFSGIRAAVAQSAADLSDVPGLDALASALGEAGRVLELLIRPAQLTGAAALARRHPDTPMVLCHLGLGAAEPSRDWSEALNAFAHAPNAHAKFSGLLSPSRTDAELADLARTAMALFGAERLMFGSDWPMSARTHAYADVVHAVRRALPDPHDRSFWSDTADRLYRS